MSFIVAGCALLVALLAAIALGDAGAGRRQATWRDHPGATSLDG